MKNVNTLLAGVVCGLTLASGAYAGYWTFDNNANDISGSGLNGTASGAYSYVAGATPGSTAIKFSTMSDATGWQNGAVAITPSSLSGVETTHNFTIEMVFRVDHANTDGDHDNWIVAQDYRNNSGWGIKWLDDTGRLVVEMGNSGSGIPSIQSTVAVNDGNWHAMAFTYDSSAHVGTLYLDGVNQGTLTSINWVYAGTSTMYIGHGYGWEAPRDFDGAVDALRITESLVDPSNFLTTTVPEPASLCLLAGSSLLILSRRKA